MRYWYKIKLFHQKFSNHEKIDNINKIEQSKTIKMNFFFCAYALIRLY